MRTNLLIGLLFFFTIQSFSQSQWYKYPGNPIIKGKSGDWDYIKIPKTVIFENDQYHMWYKGYSSQMIGYGYATSKDGIHWEKSNKNPLQFNCDGNEWENGISSINVIKIDSRYHMWYTGMSNELHSGCIGYAWSDDGFSWTKYPYPVLKPSTEIEWESWGLGGQQVIYDGSKYHMWYNGSAAGIPVIGRSGYATSLDGINWDKHPSNPVLDRGEPGNWDDHTAMVHTVLYNGTGYEMWFHGFNLVQDEIGYASSPDGVNWNKSPDNPVLQAGVMGTWDAWLTTDPAVIRQDSIYRMWYYGHDNIIGYIGYATTSVNEFKSWDTSRISKQQRIIKVQVFNSLDYIKVDSLEEVLPTLTGTELIDAYNDLALAYSLNNDKISLKYAENALKLSRETEYPQGKAMALYSRGNSQYVLDNYSEALVDHLEALRLFDSLGMVLEQANLLTQIAGIHAYAGSYDLACKYYKQALELFELQKDTGNILQSLYYLGNSMLYNGDTNNAIKQFSRRLELAIAYKKAWKRVEAHEALGRCYTHRKLDSALYHFRIAETIWDTLNPGHLDFIYMITAKAYFEEGPEYYDLAEEYYLKSYGIAGNARQLQVILLYDMAELYFNTGRYKDAREFLDISLQVCRNFLLKQNHQMFAYLNAKLDYEMIILPYMEKAYWLQYRIDTVFKMREQSFEHFMLATQWKDSIAEKQNKRQLAMMMGQYEAEGARNKIDLLERDNELKNLTLRKSRIFLFSLGALILIISIAAFIYIRNRKIRAQYEIELERVKSEKLIELDQLKSRFFANVSHEFRTPLTLIMGPLDRLGSGTENKQVQKEVATAKKYAEKLRVLINNLLSISKLESGKMHLRASETDIVQLSKRYLQAFESMAEQKKIVLKFESESRELITFIDRGKYEQVLNNLLSNALKFTGENGRIHVGISSRPSSINFPEGSVRINVSDTGIGIALEHQQYIFDRFYQLDHAEISYFEGSGIGLALCKELVRIHHGSISVNSHEGKGSTFSISLPLGKEHLKPEEIVDEDKLSLGQETSGQPLRDDSEAKTTCIDNDVEDNNKPILLIVEDNADMRGHIREYFINDFHILEAADGQDGYDKSTEHIPDIIISDVMMPKLDGNELCRMLKADERTSHIPVILLTARATKEGRIEGLETGADDFITKPFDGSELVIRVNNLIAQRLKLRELLERKIRTSHQLMQTDFSDSSITSMDESFLRKVIKVVEEEYTDPQFNIKALSLAVGLGRVQLNRKIKALTGQTTVSFIRVFRLNRAAELLKAKSATIAEIAYDVGFNSPSYFSECFRAYFGKLPSDMNGNQQE